LSDEIIFLTIFSFNNELLQTTLKFWMCFSFWITIRKALFRVFAFFFEVIDWSAIWFITYKADFRKTNRKSIARTRISQEFTIVTIIDRFTTILSIDEVLLVRTIDVIAFVDVCVDVLQINILLFVDWFKVDDADVERIDQWRDIRWWIMQFDQ
jgi:3-deoxy-D-manno-octulosonic acid (KDO) 8-phosphate synthase